MYRRPASPIIWPLGAVSIHPAVAGSRQPLQHSLPATTTSNHLRNPLSADAATNVLLPPPLVERHSDKDDETPWVLCQTKELLREFLHWQRIVFYSLLLLHADYFSGFLIPLWMHLICRDIFRTTRVWSYFNAKSESLSNLCRIHFSGLHESYSTFSGRS